MEKYDVSGIIKIRCFLKKYVFTNRIKTNDTLPKSEFDNRKSWIGKCLRDSSLFCE